MTDTPHKSKLVSVSSQETVKLIVLYLFRLSAETSKHFEKGEFFVRTEVSLLVKKFHSPNYPNDKVVILNGHSHQVLSMCVSDDGHYAFTGSSDTTIRKWDLVDPFNIQSWTYHDTPVIDLDFFRRSDGIAILLSAGKSCRIGIINADSGLPLKYYLMHVYAVTCARFDCTGERVISGSRAKQMNIWSSRTAKTLKRLALPAGMSFSRCVCVVPGFFLVAALAGRSSDGWIDVWKEGEDSAMIRLEGHSRCPLSMSPNRDRTRVVSVNRFETIIWRVDGWLKETTLRIGGFSADFHPLDPDVIVVGSEKHVRVVRVSTTETIVELRAHMDHTMRVAFTPDGSRLITASLDKKVKVWNIEQL